MRWREVGLPSIILMPSHPMRTKASTCSASDGASTVPPESRAAWFSPART